MKKSKRRCTQCQKSLPLTRFYARKRPDRRGRKETTACCKACLATQAIARQQKTKRTCVEYKGGACEKCGIVADAAIYDFHHINPRHKEFGISRRKGASIETLKAELDKCQLLCANCHRLFHAGKWR